jgi:hypothetical protein
MKPIKLRNAEEFRELHRILNQDNDDTGKSYSYTRLYDHTAPAGSRWLYTNNVDFITLAEFKKEQGIMKYKEGDVLVDKQNHEVKILGVCGLVYFRSEYGNPTRCSGSGFTEEELKKFTLKTDPTKLTTLTMEDVAKMAGVDVSSLRIEKGE